MHLARNRQFWHREGPEKLQCSDGNGYELSDFEPARQQRARGVQAAQTQAGADQRELARTRMHLNAIAFKLQRGRKHAEQVEILLSNQRASDRIAAIR